MDQAMVAERKRRYLPMNPAMIPRGRSTSMVPIEKAMVSLRIWTGETCVLPPVRYPMSPRQKTLLEGQRPAIRPKMKIPRGEGSKAAIHSRAPV